MRSGAPISPSVATNLYAALFTDTGGFRHENTTEAALRLAATLVAAGADPGWVALKSYKSRSLAQVRLEGMAVADLHSEMGGRLLWSEVSRSMLEQAGADLQDSEGIIDALQSIGTMEIAVLFKETPTGRSKISVRTREPFDATDVCTPFGGGGHRRAAGAEFADSLPDRGAQGARGCSPVDRHSAVTGVAAPGAGPRPGSAVARRGGVLPLDKPAGITSFDAIRQVRRILGERRVGHAGTLDPTATGLLPICVGRSTRFVDYFHAQPKTYHCVVRLGERSDTGDTEGVVATGCRRGRRDR